MLKVAVANMSMACVLCDSCSRCDVMQGYPQLCCSNWQNTPCLLLYALPPSDPFFLLQSKTESWPSCCCCCSYVAPVGVPHLSASSSTMLYVR